MREEMKNPIKMAIPPIDGVTFLWIFRLPGTSTKFLRSEYLIITGTIKKAMTKDVIAAASCTAIKKSKVGKNSDLGDTSSGPRINLADHQINSGCPPRFSYSN